MKRCSHCRIEKTADEFAWRNKARGIRQDFCRECKREYNRNWYQLHAVAHKENVARNGKRHKALALEIVLAAKSAPCADCGRSFPPIAMDFDHVEGVKVGNISAMTGVAIQQASAARCDTRLWAIFAVHLCREARQRGAV